MSHRVPHSAFGFFSGHVTLVEQLLSARAELRAKNARGLTPVDFARAHQDDKVRQILANFASQ